MMFCWKIFVTCLLREGGGNSGLGESDENPSHFTELTLFWNYVQEKLFSNSLEALKRRILNFYSLSQVEQQTGGF